MQPRVDNRSTESLVFFSLHNIYLFKSGDTIVRRLAQSEQKISVDSSKQASKKKSKGEIKADVRHLAIRLTDAMQIGSQILSEVSAQVNQMNMPAGRMLGQTGIVLQATDD